MPQSPARLWSLDPDVLQRARVGEASDQVDSWLLDAGANAPDERQLVDRNLDHAVVEDALDLVDQRLALLRVRLPRLALEQVLDLGDHAGRVDAVLADIGFEPGGRVAAGARDADNHVLQLLLAPCGRHGRALHGANPGADADILQIPGERLAHREVGRPGIEIARVEAAGIAGLGEQALGLR